MDTALEAGVLRPGQIDIEALSITERERSPAPLSVPGTWLGVFCVASWRCIGARRKAEASRCSSHSTMAGAKGTKRSNRPKSLLDINRFGGESIL